MKIHDLIRQTAAETPENDAVFGHDGYLTYLQLIQRSNEVTNALAAVLPKARGTQIVPVIMEKSILVVPVLLGVLQAGAAFVLADASTPPSRLRSILTLTTASCCICDPDCAALPVGLARNIMVISSKGEIAIGRDTTDSSESTPDEFDVAAESAAYIVFTSGSTGEPKGVIVSHDAFCSGVFAQAAGLNIRKESRVLQMASFSFSAFIVEILTSLVIGACVCIPSPHERLHDLSGCFRRLRPTWLVTQPSIASRLLPSFAPTLQTLVIGGESVTAAALVHWQGSDRASLIHAYGQSESCTIRCARSIDYRNPSDYRNIGSGLDATLWIVDPDNCEIIMASGQVGELLLNSNAIASRYLTTSQPAESPFISQPTWATSSSSTMGNKWYLTGDLAMELPDGTFTLIGRKDAQINLHGQRIEPAEVEQQILFHFSSEIEEVAVTTIKHGPCAEVLAAFCVPYANKTSSQVEGEESALLAERMSTALSAKLPHYMIPSRCILLSRLPKTASGKLNRPTLQGVSIQTPNRPPKDNHLTGLKDHRLYDVLLRLWVRVLGVIPESVGQDSDFFMTGGDSITALAFVNLAQEVEVGLTYQQVFRKRHFGPILEALIRSDTERNPVHVEAAHGISHKRGISGGAIEPTFRPGTLPSRVIEANLLESMGLGFQFHLSFNGSIKPTEIFEAFQKCFEKHEMLRATFHKLATGEFSLEVLPADAGFILIENPPANAAAFTRRRMQVGQDKFVLGQPFAKLTLVLADDGTFSALLRLSQAQFDGLSLLHLWRDLISAYDDGNEFSTDTPFTAHNILARVCDSSGKSQAYWEQMLMGALPSNIKSTPSLATNRDSIVDLEAGCVIQHSHNLLHRTTLACVVYVTWAIILSDLCNTEDVVFAHLVNGRNSGSSMDQGFFCFANEIILRVKVPSAWCAEYLLAQVEMQQLESFEYCNLGLGDAIKAAGWDKNTCISSFVQHQNIDERHNLTFKDGYCSIEYKENEVDFEDIRLFTRPRRAGLEVHLQASHKRFSVSELESILNQFCRTFRKVDFQLTGQSTVDGPQYIFKTPTR
ncbi:hypothetical protein V502_02634 [Pseudogymnoascus sp. VKM F-4520 (FW-2644)]|nr:hypothetical protein V502_02634 [Pseudogymnoascus sp. VKM F-4520 (FW-2644)]